MCDVYTDGGPGINVELDGIVSVSRFMTSCGWEGDSLAAGPDLRSAQFRPATTQSLDILSRVAVALLSERAGNVRDWLVVAFLFHSSHHGMLSHLRLLAGPWLGEGGREEGRESMM